VVELLLTFFQLGFQNNDSVLHILVGNLIIFVPAKPTIVIQLIGVGFINGDVVHVLAFGAKFHFLIYYILLLYVIIHKIKSILGGGT
jgi:hypothetical protein